MKTIEKLILIQYYQYYTILYYRNKTSTRYCHFYSFTTFSHPIWVRCYAHTRPQCPQLWFNLSILQKTKKLKISVSEPFLFYLSCANILSCKWQIDVFGESPCLLLNTENQANLSHSVLINVVLEHQLRSPAKKGRDTQGHSFSRIYLKWFVYYLSTLSSQRCKDKEAEHLKNRNKTRSLTQDVEKKYHWT